MRKPRPSPVAAPRSKKKPTPAVPSTKGIVGKVTIKPLANVKPNDWNPNEMDGFTFESLKQGLIDDGWLISDSLLVWRSDETGALRMQIINGEHRWKAAREIGMQTGPMVFLDNLTREDAIKLTIKLDNKRGSFNRTKLANLVRGFDAPHETLSLELGFNTTDLQRLLGVPSLPTSAFTETTIEAKVEYCCPNCSHKWSGEKKPKRNKK